MNSEIYYKDNEFSFILFLKFFLEFKFFFVLLIFFTLILSFIINSIFLKKYNQYTIEINTEFDLSNNFFKNNKLFANFDMESMCILLISCKNTFSDINEFRFTSLNSLYIDKKFHKQLFNKLSHKRELSDFSDYFSNLKRSSFLSNSQKKFVLKIDNHLEINEYVKLYKELLKDIINKLTIDRYTKSIYNSKLRYINSSLKEYKNVCNKYRFLNCKFYSDIATEKNLLEIQENLNKFINNLSIESNLKYSKTIYEDKKKNVFIYNLIDRVNKELVISKIKRKQINNFLNILLNYQDFINVVFEVEKINFKIINFYQLFLILFLTFLLISIVIILCINLFKIKSYSIK